MPSSPLHPRRLFRQWHRWAALLVALPFLLVIVTGILLQVKKEVAWVQPPTQKGKGKEPTLGYDQLLAALQSVPEAQIASWKDVDRLDVRIKDGIVKVQAKNAYEVQVDFQTGQVLQVAYRRSDLIETLHDGSWFHPSVKTYVFLGSGLLVLTLWLTGTYLFFLPYAVKWQQRRTLARAKQVASPRQDT